MLLPLLAYHAFILVGAAVLLIGVIRGSIPLTVGGVILVAVGIAIQTLVLRWSAALTAEAARRGASAPAPSSPADPRTRAEWLCIACAWKGSGAVRYCPRCGKFLIRLLPWDGSPPHAGLPIAER